MVERKTIKIHAIPGSVLKMAESISKMPGIQEMSKFIQSPAFQEQARLTRSFSEWYPEIEIIEPREQKRQEIEPRGVTQQEVTRVIRDELRRSARRNIANEAIRSVLQGGLDDKKPPSKTSRRKKGDADKARSAHVVKWVDEQKYKGGTCDTKIVDALRLQEPTLWGEKGIETFKTWIKTPEGKEVRHLLPNVRRK